MVEMKGVDPKMIANNLTPFYTIHPGEVLKDEVKARNISQKSLASYMNMSYKELNDILNERRPLTAETAIMFETALGISAKTLMELQVEYSIANARKDKTFCKRLKMIRPAVAIS